MAKHFNWQKLRQDSKSQTDREQTMFETSHKQDFHMFNDSGLWSLKGKYYGTPVKKLPFHYMEWVLDNMKSPIHHQIITKEYYRRVGKIK